MYNVVKFHMFILHVVLYNLKALFDQSPQTDFTSILIIKIYEEMYRHTSSDIYNTLQEYDLLYINKLLFNSPFLR